MFRIAVAIVLCLVMFATMSWAADGDLKWRFWTADLIDSSPAIGTDGTIYVGSCTITRPLGRFCAS